MREALIREISKKIYSLFVVNTCAAGIQQNDGRYITKYIPISAELVERMIETNGSMGCYQQGYKTGYIKWICLDFDCKDKDSPDLDRLYFDAIVPVKKALDRLGISYLTEYSGRRGIHIWVFFDCIIKKSVGFRILNEIINQSGIDETAGGNIWNLDKFPASDSSLNNKVGKQVKFPLSTHQRTNGMSYFFTSDFSFRPDIRSEQFFNDQLRILNEYCPNKIKDVLEALGQTTIYEQAYKYKYIKYRLLESIDVSVDDIWGILSETKVFSNIYSRMKTGQSLPMDWTVMLGTLSLCDSDGAIIKAVFEEFPNYDEHRTVENIQRLRNTYFPATFGYLYCIYGLDIEDELDPNQTGFSYLINKLHLDYAIVKDLSQNSEIRIINSVSDTVAKEKKYLMENDEVPDVYTFNMLNGFKSFDKETLESEINKAITGQGFCNFVGQVRIFFRKESMEKTRMLVSLSARDRVITTHLALKLFYLYRRKWNSFSYRPSVSSREDIFYSWYNSWGSYIDRIRSFLDVPFFSDYGIILIDLKGFYDHVDFLAVNNSIEDDIDPVARNILAYLIRYNDLLMAKINNCNRIGVPQGPAYARIISEVFLNRILNKVEEEYSGEIRIIRYVDDIVFVCNPGTDYNSFYERAIGVLSDNGLPINKEKSNCFGRIGDLTDAEKSLLLHSDCFDYDLRCDDKVGLLFASDRKARLKSFLHNHDFDIRSLGYVFGNNTLQESKDWYFENYRYQIFGSCIGRGSSYKKFYQYVFENSSFLEKALEEKLFCLIPVDSINFSNCISILYYEIQAGKIDGVLFNRIKELFLNHVDAPSMNKDDLAVLKALQNMK